jgi:protein SCO1/2
LKLVFSYILILFLFALTILSGQVGYSHEGEEKIPYELQGVGIDEKTGSKIDLSLNFTDEKGQTQQLKNYFNDHKPVVMILTYYGCPNLCTLVLNGTIDSLNQINLKAGKDYNLVAVSFDPKETPTLAQEKKTNYLKTFQQKNAEDSFHFLTGAQASIEPLTAQMGFKYKWDKDQEQYAHASAIYVVTPQGQISRQLYGVMYAPRDLKLSLIEASEGKIGSVMDQLLLFCYHYDATAKKYVLWARKMMTLGGAVTLAVLGIIMALFWINEFKKSKLKLNQQL